MIFAYFAGSVSCIRLPLASKTFVSFCNDFKRPNQHFSHIGQSQRFLVVLSALWSLTFSQANYTVKVCIKSRTSRSGALFYHHDHYAIALPTSQNELDLPSNGCLLALVSLII